MVTKQETPATPTVPDSVPTGAAAPVGAQRVDVSDDSFTNGRKRNPLDQTVIDALHESFKADGKAVGFTVASLGSDPKSAVQKLRSHANHIGYGLRTALVQNDTVLAVRAVPRKASDAK